MGTGDGPSQVGTHDKHHTAETSAERLTAGDPPWANLIEVLRAVFYIERPDGSPVYVSPHIEAVVGCTPEEWALGRGAWIHRVHPDDRARVLGTDQRHPRPGVAQTDEYRVVLDDGSVRSIHDRAVLESDPDGEPLIHGMVVDVTAERTSAEIAERAGELFRALVVHASEAVTIVNSQGVVVYQNPSMGKVVGRPPEWFEGGSPLDLMPPDDAALGRQILAEVQEHPGAQLPGEFRLKHRDGTWRIVAGVATNLLDDPAVRGIVLNYRDVTEERETTGALEVARTRRRTLLEEIVQAEVDERSRIAEELHDDTIQVMAATLLEIDRLLRHLNRGDAANAGKAAAAARSTLAAAAERTRLLAFELRPQSLDSRGLAIAVRDLTDALALHSGVSVRLRTRLGRYPPIVETLVYRTVREALINVRKHAQASEVTVRLSQRRGVLHGQIEDDGHGFRTDGRSIAHATKHFGLAAAGERLEAAGGKFELISAAGQGTTVNFELPLTDL